MTDAHKETGYGHKRKEKRKPIADYGKAAEAEKAKQEVKRLKGELNKH